MSRFLWTTSALVGLLVTLSLLAPSSLTDLGLDLWNVPDLYCRLEAARHRHAELEEQNAAILRRLALKDRIIRELVAGRITFLQAAARFERLHEGQPCPPAWSDAFPPANRKEHYCRQIIVWVRIYISTHPEYPVPDLAQRLERELAVCLSSPDGLHFRPLLSEEGLTIQGP